MDDSAPETWADAAPLEEAEFTYSNMTSFLSGMGVGPFAGGRAGANTGPRLGNADAGDPLGLNGADASPRTRMRAQRDRRETTRTEDIAGTQISGDDFDPARFLAVRHHDASYEQLKSGLDTLSKTIHDHKRLLKSLVLQHFDQFLRCKDSIDNLQEGLQEQGGSHIDRVNELYDELAESGDKLYKPLLDAKRDTERTRSGLQVLRQYRFLFEIPVTILDSMQAKEYEKVVKEYRRAKLLVSQSDRPVYRRVWMEVEKIVKDFRAELLNKITAEAELPWEQHRPIVNCLVQLDCPVNPVGQLLIARQQSLQSLLDDAFQTLQARVDTAAEREWERISIERSVLYDADAGQKRATSHGEVAASEHRVRSAIRHSCMANLSAEYLQKISKIVIERLPSMCDAASQLSDVSTENSNEAQNELVKPRSSIASTSSAGGGPPLILGELLEKALSVYCDRVLTVLGTDAKWWRREFVVSIRACRDSLRSCSQRFKVPWVHFRAVAQLDGRVAWRYAEKRWEAALGDVARIADQTCLRAAAGISESDDTLGEFSSSLHVLSNTGDMADESLALLEGQWDTMSPTERAMEDTIGAFEEIMRQAFRDLSVVYTNASALRGSSERLRNLSRAAMFEACGSFADCIHQVAFHDLPKHHKTPGIIEAINTHSGGTGANRGVERLSSNLLNNLTLGSWAGGDAVEEPLLLLLRLLHHAIHVTINALFDELPAVTQIDDEDDDVGTLEAALNASSPVSRAGSRSPRTSSTQQPEDDAPSEEVSASGISGQLAKAVENASNATYFGRSGVLSLFKELHELLLARHCCANSVVLRQLVSSGISRAGVVWEQWPRPHEIRGYVINLLLHCVKIHADTVSTVPAELNRVLGAALEVICGAFREEVDMIAESLSLHSAEQLNLELNFVTTTMEDFETAVSAGRAKMCRTLLSKKRLAAIDTMDRKAREQQAVDDANLQKVHEDAFVANEVMFSCFRTEPLMSLNSGAADAAAAAAMAAKTGAERRRSEQRRLGASALAAAPVGTPPGTIEGETHRQPKVEAGTTHNAFVHTRPNRTSLAGRRQSQLSSTKDPDAIDVAVETAKSSSAQARANRQSRLISTKQAVHNTATGTSSGMRPRTPPDRGVRPVGAQRHSGNAASPKQANAVTGRNRGAGPGAPSRQFSSSHHVKPRQPVVSTFAAPTATGPPSSHGAGLTLSPASVAQSGTASVSKPPSPPPRTALTAQATRGGGGMGSVASAARLTGAARVGKARRRRGGDV